MATNFTPLAIRNSISFLVLRDSAFSSWPLNVLLAELLKHFYPKLVDLHNYCPACSKACKINNWAVLNRKVLSKLNMKLSQGMIEQLAESVPGVVESLLQQLHIRIRELNEQSQPPAEPIVYYEDEMDVSDINQIPCKVINGDKNSPKQMKKVISSRVLAGLKEDLAVKEEAIVILKDKVTHLENLLELKNQRIRDLSAQLGRCQTNLNSTPAPSLPRQSSYPS